ncbi:MAG: hypothetical protein ABL961_17090 [Vicinamibacterales bacterium]
MVAGPYRSGAASAAECQANLDRLNKIALGIFEKGHTPVIGVNLALPVIRVAGVPRYEEIMMPLSLRLADRCDGVIRAPGISAGADLEVERIRAAGGRVFRDIDEIPSVAAS